jgi:hypothetical protein
VQQHNTSALSEAVERMQIEDVLFAKDEGKDEVEIKQAKPSRKRTRAEFNATHNINEEWVGEKRKLNE